MPFDRPTRSQLIQQAQTDMARALGVPGLLRFSPEMAAAVATAGMVDGLYAYLDWIAREAMPFEATEEYLESWAGLVGTPRKQATSAGGPATFYGTPDAVLYAGARVSGNGVTYLTVSEGVVSSGGVVTVPIAAEEPGAEGNAEINTPLVLEAAVAGVTSTGVASGPLAGGAPAEKDDAFRLRMLLRWSTPPQGGAASDYVEWALAVPGVTRAWINPNGARAGTVVVYTMWDEAEASHGGFPQGADGVATLEKRATAAVGDQLVVANALHPLRPVTALVYHCAPVPFPVPFSFRTRVLVADAVKQAVLAAIDEVFEALADPLGGILEQFLFIPAHSRRR